MATQLRKTENWVQPMADAHNALKAQIGASSNYHLDKSEVKPQLSAPTDLPSLLLVTKELIGVYRFHAADTLAHKIVDSGLLPNVSDPVDQTTINTALNLIKTFHGTHIASTAINYTADVTDTISSPNATDLASAITLATELQTDITAHMNSGPSAPSIRVIPA